MKRAGVFLLAFILLSGLAAIACADEEETPFQLLDHAEKIVYGAPTAGGLIPRLSRIETDLFGRELPGSVAEREQALLNFLEKGTPSSPSFLFKLGVAEWAVQQKIFPEKPALERVSNLEQNLQGKTQPEGALSMRLERLLTSLLPGSGVQWTQVTLPATTVFKVELLQNLSAHGAKAGDPVRMDLVSDLAVGNCLVAPRGSLVVGHVDSVSGPKSFGRSSEVKVAFDYLQPLGPDRIPIFLGNEAKQASKVDNSTVAAAGASFLGLVVLGPVGLAGGFLVRGDDKEVPSGTMFYLETTKEMTVYAYPLSKELQNLVVKEASSADKTPSSVSTINGEAK